MIEKNILLITYVYPPSPSIGARRWAKITKYLARNGYKIRVLTAKSAMVGGANWIEDIDNPNITVYYVDDKRPKLLWEGTVRRKDYFLRLLRKIYIYYLEYFVGGLWMDEARFMKEDVLSHASDLINKFNIRNVISTGPPHNLNYYTALLKEQFPDINVLCDFRDSWTDAKNYSYENIPIYVVNEEEKKQTYTFLKANILFFTYKKMRDDLSEKYNNIASSKFIYLPHAFDHEDYGIPKNEKKNTKLRVVYGGAITMDVCYTTAKIFLDSLVVLKSNPDYYNKVELVFFNQNVFFKKMVADRDLFDIIQIHDHIPEKEFFKVCTSADLLLTILGDGWKDYITSKAIMQLGFRKSILMVAEDGQATDFIISNKLGYVLNSTSDDNFWTDLIINFENGSLFYENNNFEQYSYENLAKTVESYFI